MHTVNIRVTHRRADVETLETFAFPDVEKALREIHSLPHVEECVIVQTCNRVEIFAASENVKAARHHIVDYIMEDVLSRMRRRRGISEQECVPPEVLANQIIKFSSKLHDVMEVEYHTPALRHLLRLASGVESMIVGEDQILGQVREAYNLAVRAGTVGQFFEKIFTKALHVGKLVRSTTGINKGAVSIGSAAVELAEEVLGSLKGRVVLLIGAGEMGKLVSKALAGYEPGEILVANRTESRAVRLAEELGGRAVRFEDIPQVLPRSDLVITATGSAEPIITRKMLEGKSGEMVIIDVAIPRNVSQDVSSLPGVRLLNIDDLREVAERNRKAREREIERVEEIIERELGLLIRHLYRIDVEDIVSGLFREAERVRRREVERALRMLGNGVDERKRRVIEDLSRVLVKRITSPIAENLRRAAEMGDQEAVRVAEKLLGRGGEDVPEGEAEKAQEN